PKVRPGSYFPSLLEPRRRGERALAAVVQEAYVHGVSTRKVDELMKALGLDGISKSEVSRVCAALDVEVEAFRSRRLEGEYPYVWLDATYHKVRHAGRGISMATGAAMGADGRGGAAGAWRGRGARRGRGLLDRVPARAGRARAAGRAAGDL